MTFHSRSEVRTLDSLDSLGSTARRRLRLLKLTYKVSIIY
jgi:hypothetical protein